MIQTETDRLIIRNWNHADIPAYANIVSDPDVMQFIGTGKTLTASEAEAYVERCLESSKKNGWSRFVVEHKETHELMGFCGFAYYNEELDFGWRYAQRFWHQGYATEAAQAVLRLGLQKFKFPRIVCIAYPANKASIKIIEKLGMSFEKEFELNGHTVKQYVQLNTKTK